MCIYKDKIKNPLSIAKENLYFTKLLQFKKSVSKEKISMSGRSTDVMHLAQPL